MPDFRFPFSPALAIQTNYEFYALHVARYLPDWLPFMERLRYAHTWRFAIENITRLPFEASMRKMVWQGLFTLSQLGEANIGHYIPDQIVRPKILYPQPTFHIPGEYPKGVAERV